MTFEEILSSGNYHLIDVRQPEELVMEGKVEGAINIPLATVPLKIDEIKEMKSKNYFLQKRWQKRTSVSILSSKWL